MGFIYEIKLPDINQAITAAEIIAHTLTTLSNQQFDTKPLLFQPRDTVFAYGLYLIDKYNQSSKFISLITAIETPEPRLQMCYPAQLSPLRKSTITIIVSNLLFRLTKSSGTEHNNPLNTFQLLHDQH